MTIDQPADDASDSSRSTRQPSSPDESRRADLAAGAETVLVIDDDGDDRHIMARALRKVRPEVHILEAGSAKDGLERLRRDDPDLVLLDLRMHGLDGFSVLAAARDDPDMLDVPMVVVSTSSNPDDVSRAYRLAANAYVLKPSTMDGYDRLARRLVDFWFDTAVRA